MEETGPSVTGAGTVISRPSLHHSVWFRCCSVEGLIPEALAWVLTCHCTEAVAVLWAPVCAGCALSSTTAVHNLCLGQDPGSSAAWLR